MLQRQREANRGEGGNRRGQGSIMRESVTTIKGSSQKGGDLLNFNDGMSVYGKLASLGFWV